MKNNLLDDLILSGDIISYDYHIINENGKSVENVKGSRNTEQLEIVFKSGKKLVIDTFCSGFAENVAMIFSRQKETYHE